MAMAVGPHVAPRRAVVVQVLPALESGGAERSALEIALAVVAAGDRSVVVSAGGRLVPMLEAEGSEHVTLDVGRKSPVTLFKVRALRRVFAAVNADIVHVRSRLPAWIAWRAIRGMRRPPHFVTTVHGLNSPSWYSSIMVRGERIIVVSHTVRDYVLRHYPWLDRTHLREVPRGVDPLEFPYGYRPEEAWRAAFFAEFPTLVGAPLLTLPGRGTRLKGHADAIRLVADLKARGIDVRLLLLGIIEAGREAYVAEMRALAANLGVADRVVLSPPRADVREVYAVSALVLQLSVHPESFGRTVVEALSLCRPVLGYAHGGVGDLLAELYPAGRVAAGDHVRLAERAAELLRLAPPIAPLKSYTLASMQRGVLAVYRELLDRPA